MVCRLLLKTSGSISHKHPSVKKWMLSLTKLLKNSMTNKTQRKKKKKKKKDDDEDGDAAFVSFEEASNKNDKKKQQSKDMDLNGIWSSLCLLSTSYRIITSGSNDWNKHCSLILELLENAMVFYHPILRTRCFETLCEIIEYSQCIHSTNSYQLSMQSSAALIRFLQNLLIEIVLNKNVSFNLGGRLLHTLLMTLYRLFANGKNSNRNSNISLITKACFHCLSSNDLKIRSTAIGMSYFINVSALNYTLRFGDIFHFDDHQMFKFNKIRQRISCFEHCDQINVRIHNFQTFSFMNYAHFCVCF